MTLCTVHIIILVMQNWPLLVYMYKLSITYLPVTISLPTSTTVAKFKTDIHKFLMNIISVKLSCGT